ncbi:MAG: hypothetical protein ABS943_06060 [Pantoea agglomerans]
MCGEEMRDYLIVKLLNTHGAYFPHALYYGAVELRPPSSDTTKELDVLASSAKKANVDFSHFKICSRIATVVKSKTREQAIISAEGEFAVVLDLLSADVPLSSFTLSDVGFTKDLADGTLSEIVNDRNKFNASFFVHHGSLQKRDVNHYILNNSDELSERYLRALHWRRNSKNESNIQLSILFDYFAAEALFKEREGDNIGGFIRWFMGFPNGRESQYISPLIMNEINCNERYLYWNKKLIDILEEMRIFRNNSVHHGFRWKEFDNADMELFQQVMIYGVSRSLAAVKAAIISGITSASEFKDYLVEIFEQQVNPVDIHGNIIYSLDNKFIR